MITIASTRKSRWAQPSMALNYSASYYSLRMHTTVPLVICIALPNFDLWDIVDNALVWAGDESCLIMCRFNALSSLQTPAFLDRGDMMGEARMKRNNYTTVT